MRYKVILILLGIHLLLGLQPVLSQHKPLHIPPAEVVIGDQPAGGLRMERLEVMEIPVAAKTANQTLLLPFFDDFAYETHFPDTLLWQYDSIRFPYISRTMGINPPSIGCVVMDGSNRRGSYYSLPGPNPPYPEGNADQLTSLPIDLSLYIPSDNIYLSFMYQPKGLGNAPEIQDSLMVFFRDTTTAFPRFVKVWSIPGSDFHSFRNVLIPVNDARFFHDNFQFSIRNKATLTGQLDHWLIDYVFLDGNRTAVDTVFNDQTLEVETPPIIFPYTEISLKQFTAVWWERFRNFGVSMRNLSAVSAPRTLVTNISEIKHGAFFTGNVSYNLPVNLNLGPQVVAFQAFENQGFQDYMKIRHTTLLDLPDARPLNDTVRVDYAIDSLLAYDDASPEAAYGLNTARTFAQRYQLIQPDSISSVEMCFIKTIYNVDIPRSFILTIFEGDNFPTNIIYEQFAAALVLDSVNSFFKIALDSLIPVGNTFWVGLKQTDPEPIGLGLDFNHNNTRIMWDSLQVWVQSSVSATLMIRLLLSKGEPVPFGMNKKGEAGAGFQIWPNPFQGNKLFWKQDLVSHGYFHLFDLMGRERTVYFFEGSKGWLNPEDSIEPGIYFLDCRDSMGQSLGTLKWIK